MSNLDQLCLSLLLEEHVEFVGSPTSGLCLALISILKARFRNVKTIRVYFPEGTASACNGVGSFTMDESTFPMSSFSILGISYSRPLIPAKISCKTSGFLGDLLYMLYSPITFVRVKQIPFKQTSQMTHCEVTETVRTEICNAMDLKLLESEPQKDSDNTKFKFDMINVHGDTDYKLLKRKLYEENQNKWVQKNVN
ncbi:hypothetical protein RF11_13121 [Thelohanellus kitauei]|uniref:Uncharacterized protein n=1 Tax=Thelohanellus kitauei TaxID=669202 RepID=A0A0C2J646_THEKT|nr:hypothetical protein RF11_13121 [Thelohanellus kitauei]